MTGPSTVDSPITGPSAAKALPICAGGNRSRIRPKHCGIISAADSPCSTRAATSTPGVQAVEQATEASTKPASPMSSTRRRPTMSPSRAPAISPTASDSV